MMLQNRCCGRNGYGVLALEDVVCGSAVQHVGGYVPGD
jgi:hypothetical protein